ncbi:FdtA/QdtA family cupin domain-containing protein [Candidatus Peregrinibacteria bacterium]|nr:MAG: FdtA/QdtA family cupin domain-containing protein [Candidatus Peregrinibacteria bacterium]
MSGIIRETEFPSFEEAARGKLVPIELDSAIPFPTKRVYYLWGVPVGAVRGGHAHTIEKEFFICLRGRCTLKFSTDGSPLQKISLNNPRRGIFVDNLVWHEFCDFSPDAILLCFSSTSYLPDNYISDFEDFRKVCKEQ